MMPQPVTEQGDAKPRARTSRVSRAKLGRRASHKMSVETVELSNIDFEDTTFQFRFSSESKELVSSLEHESQHEPIDLVGLEPPFRIVDGFRRFAAARELGWHSIEAFVHGDSSEREAMRIAFTKNVVRRNLSSLERAHAIVRARKQGLGRTEIADLFGLSQRQVNRYQELLSLPEHIQSVCEDGLVTMAHAKVLADFQVRDPQDWGRRIRDDNLDARSLRKLLIQDRGGKLKGRPRAYFIREKNRVRLYGCRISLNAPRDEKERFIGALNEVIDLLRKETQDTVEGSSR